MAMIPIITYYGIGWIQFGYRYALDFLPLALLLAAPGFPNPMSTPIKRISACQRGCHAPGEQLSC